MPVLPSEIPGEIVVPHTPTDNGMTIGDGNSQLSLTYLDPSDSDAPLCIIIPLDNDIPERVEAVRRLWRLLQNAPAPDQRVSPERRDRLRAMIRAMDGVTLGASHRDIASRLYGTERVRAEDWPASSLRYATIRLLRDGKAIIEGGYKDLLKPPKTDGRRKRYRPSAE